MSNTVAAEKTVEQLQNDEAAYQRDAEQALIHKYMQIYIHTYTYVRTYVHTYIHIRERTRMLPLAEIILNYIIHNY